ncbi:MAG TPA: DUF2911 domain-containing protein [Longimicrobiaceae bacterium]|nr:DUF2911 domain-containing protein [Longimicrobiaceae bacterium]
MLPSAPRRRPGTGAALLLLASVATAAGPAAAQAARPDSAALVTVLGRDTIALERWVRTGNRIEAEAVVRAPSTSLRRYSLDLAPSGGMRRFEERVLDPASPGGSPRRVETIEAADSGWTRRVTEGDSTRSSRVQAGADALPWVDLVHWPFELALRSVPASGTATRPFLAAGRPLAYTLARTAPGQVTLTHPMRGPSTVRTDAAGRLLGLDAAQTTRKVVVTRVPWVDVEGPARRWAEADRAGRGMGELSGRAREEFTVAGAKIELDYGVPVRRGRDIFPAVVAWGQVWRTGANRATHFSTDRPLVLGDPAAGPTLAVTAGEYTLFSAPEAAGGLLIVSRQTGQNGTAHDPARDLGRVRMRRTTVAEPVERFTIRAEPAGTKGGALRISWDRSVFEVPFTVQ